MFRVSFVKEFVKLSRTISLKLQDITDYVDVIVEERSVKRGPFFFYKQWSVHLQVNHL